MDDGLRSAQFFRQYHRLVWSVVVAIVVAASSATLNAAEPTFSLKFSQETHAEPYSGRVYIFFAKSEKPAPRFGPSWFGPEPFCSLEVTDWKPDTPLEITPKTPGVRSFPKPLDELKLTGLHAQAVVRFNPYERNVGTGPGNGFSDVVEITDDKPVQFTINQLVEEPKFVETEWTKLFEVKSERLSKFHGRDVSLKAAVILPASYQKEPERRYPIIFTIPGFGGTHFRGIRDEPIPEMNAEGVEFLRVVLDPSCPLGHHVFADSANNGPVGTAFVKEFIPAFDQQFRTVAAPTARFLNGHSSGGWSSLWLQVTYPDSFGGTWSTGPDPVDFRDFQRINLYQPGENMYRDAAGERRPLARRGEQVVVWYQDFADMEWVLDYGGQLHSFEAVFSEKGEDGKPVLIWDRKTGQVNTDVAKTWKKYDIRLILEENWNTLGPKLAGKIHVIMGEEDTFYLEGATRLLKESQAKLKTDAVIEMVPGKDHSNLLSRELSERIRSEMTAAFLKHHKP